MGDDHLYIQLHSSHFALNRPMFGYHPYSLSYEYLPTESLFDECCAAPRHCSVDFDGRMPTACRPKCTVQESPLKPTHEEPQTHQPLLQC